MENERAHLSGHGSGRYLQNPNPEMSKRAQGLPERYPAPKNKRGRQFVDDITHGHAGLFMVRNSFTGASATSPTRRANNAEAVGRTFASAGIAGGSWCVQTAMSRDLGFHLKNGLRVLNVDYFSGG